MAQNCNISLVSSFIEAIFQILSCYKSGVIYCINEIQKSFFNQLFGI